jgi:hypothetical protein
MNKTMQYRHSNLQAILLGGITAAVLEIIPALIVHANLGVSPAQVFQAIASGLLGKAAYSGQGITVALGIFLHLFISVIAAAVFVSARARLPLIATRSFPAGVVFGLLVYGFMSWIVVPLSAAAFAPANDWRLLAMSVATHVFLFGVPIAYFARVRKNGIAN